MFPKMNANERKFYLGAATEGTVARQLLCVSKISCAKNNNNNYSRSFAFIRG